MPSHKGGHHERPKRYDALDLWGTILMGILVAVIMGWSIAAALWLFLGS